MGLELFLEGWKGLVFKVCWFGKVFRPDLVGLSFADLLVELEENRLGFGVGEGKGGQSASALEKSSTAGGRSGLG